MAYRDNKSRKMNPADAHGEEGVANDPVYTGEAYAADARPEIARKTVGGHFERKESVTARAYNSDGAANDERYLNDEAANDEQYSPAHPGRRRGGSTVPESIEQAERAAALSESLRGRMQGGRARMGAAPRAVAGLKAAKAFAGWNVLWIVGVAYLWQLLFAVISLIGFTIHGYILDVQSNSWWGRLTSVFVDFSKIIPGEMLGYAFYGINFILVMGLFICLVLWYYLGNGISVLSSTMSALITFACLALSIMPVTNLFPWLLLWVIYMELLKTKLAVTSLFSTAT